MEQVAKQLGIDYARAVVGFNHTRRGAIPTFRGIVTITDNEQLVRDGLVQYEGNLRLENDANRSKLVLSRWAKLVVSLLSLSNLKAKYL